VSRGRLRAKKCEERSPPALYLAIACDWETTCLIRRIEFLDVQIAFAAWYFLRRLEV
jgi:hypothetical protein